MNTQEQNQTQDDMWNKIEKSHRRGKIMGGFLIVIIGSIFMARELGAQIPEWLFSWKTLLIAIGLISAVKHRFRNPGWIVLVGIGSAFLLNDLYPEMHLKPFLLPVFLIVMGLFIMFKPRRHRMEHLRNCRRNRFQHMKHQGIHKFDPMQEGETATDDYLEFNTIMAGVKKNVLSKKFKGGKVLTVLGGTELNLIQADLDGKATLDITQVLGGTKLVLPANWVLKSEMVTVMGSVEDKRPLPAMGGATEPEKLLILTGNTFMGGVEIVSY
jgi:predicted membrane protein